MEGPQVIMRACLLDVRDTLLESPLLMAPSFSSTNSRVGNDSPPE
jgi:hypothetical protein